MLLSNTVYHQTLVDVYSGRTSAFSFVSSDKETYEDYIAFCAKRGYEENEISAAKFIGKYNSVRYNTLLSDDNATKGALVNYLVVDPDQIDIYGEYVNTKENLYAIPNDDDIKTLRKIQSMCAKLYRRGINPQLIQNATKLKMYEQTIFVSKDNQVFIVVNVYKEDLINGKDIGSKVYMKVPIKIDIDALERSVYVFFLRHPGIIFSLINPKKGEGIEEDYLIYVGNHNLEIIKSTYDQITRKKIVDGEKHPVNRWATNSKDQTASFSRLKTSLIKVFGEANYSQYFIQDIPMNSNAFNDSKLLSLSPNRIKFIEEDYVTYANRLL